MATNEHFTGSRLEELDEEDLALQMALAGMQEVVDRHFARVGKDASLLSPQEVSEFVDRVMPYLEFELDTSDAIWRPMPIEARGDGAFLLVDQGGDSGGMDFLSRQERLTGMIEAIQPYPVPTTRWLNEHRDTTGSMTLDDKTMSAVLVLEGARYHGERARYDLSDYHVLLPVIYGMPTTMVDTMAG